MWRATKGGATVVVEDFAPIVISTWYGTVGPELIDEVYDHTESLYRATEIPYRVAIAHMVELHRMPRASERRQLAERTERLGRLTASDQHNFVVMRSTLARSGLTAVQWLLRTQNRAETCSTVEEALRRARRTLDSMGVPWPEGLDPATYSVPDRGQASAAG